MKLENTVCFRCNLYTCPDSHKFWDAVEPQNSINSIWIPQTIGDQIWMWFEFATIEEKETYLKSIQDLTVTGTYDVMRNGKTYEEEQSCKPIDMLMNNEDWLTQAEIDHWVGIDTGYNPLRAKQAKDKFCNQLKKESIWDKLEYLEIGGKRIK